MDENFKPFKYRDADLVGITAMTASSSRAYEIATAYKNRGVPVIMGGIHASALPEEALAYVDSVVIGEAEGSWPGVVADFEAGRLQRKYESPLFDLRNAPSPRHDLFHPGYLFSSIQTSRGCPMDCDFCSVPWFNGNQYRLRETEVILEEISRVRSPMLYFVDDNIIGYNARAEEHAVALFEGIIRRKIKKEWFAQASINIGDKPELLRLAARSGCRMLLLGIEAEIPEALEFSNKRLNLKIGVSHYQATYKRLHRAGISVLGAFMFGMDTDSIRSIRDRIRYITSSSVDVVQASVMTPLPGTRLYQQMKSEGRLIPETFPGDWQHFHFTDVVFKPALMTPEELATEVSGVYQKLADSCYLRKRFLRTLWNTRNLRTAVWSWNSNLNYQSMVREREVAWHYE